MIDTDKMKVAFAATPLCQGAWTEKGDGDTPTKLCAISSLVSFAGVQPDLIAKMDAVETNAAYLKMYGWGSMRVPQWVATLAMPVLHAEYGIPTDIAASFPSIFDRQENEWRGVAEVLALCEQHNTAEMHTEAIAEDSFPLPAAWPRAAARWTPDHHAALRCVMGEQPVHRIEEPHGVGRGVQLHGGAAREGRGGDRREAEGRDVNGAVEVLDGLAEAVRPEEARRVQVTPLTETPTMPFGSDDNALAWLRFLFGGPVQRIEVCPVCTGAGSDYEGDCLLCAGEGVLPMTVGALDDRGARP